MREQTKPKKSLSKLELLELKLNTKNQKSESSIKKFKPSLWKTKESKEKLKIKNILLVKTKSLDRDNKAQFTKITEHLASGNKSASLKILELPFLIKKEKH